MRSLRNRKTPHACSCASCATGVRTYPVTYFPRRHAIATSQSMRRERDALRPRDDRLARRWQGFGSMGQHPPNARRAAITKNSPRLGGDASVDRRRKLEGEPERVRTFDSFPACIVQILPEAFRSRPPLENRCVDRPRNDFRPKQGSAHTCSRLPGEWASQLEVCAEHGPAPNSQTQRQLDPLCVWGKRI
jgi:hypothetical protein